MPLRLKKVTNDSFQTLIGVNNLQLVTWNSYWESKKPQKMNFQRDSSKSTLEQDWAILAG